MSNEMTEGRIGSHRCDPGPCRDCRLEQAEKKVKALESTNQRLTTVLQSSNIPSQCQCSECRDIVAEFSGQENLTTTSKEIDGSRLTTALTACQAEREEFVKALRSAEACFGVDGLCLTCRGLISHLLAGEPTKD